MLTAEQIDTRDRAISRSRDYSAGSRVVEIEGVAEFIPYAGERAVILTTTCHGGRRHWMVSKTLHEAMERAMLGLGHRQHELFNDGVQVDVRVHAAVSLDADQEVEIKGCNITARKGSGSTTIVFANESVNAGLYAELREELTEIARGLV